MNEYISKDALRKHLNECITDDLFDRDMKKAVIGIDVYVENMPAADVQHVKHGRWESPVSVGNGIKFCSVCRNEAYWDTDYGQQLFDYCPYCGARMIKDGDVNE